MSSWIHVTAEEVLADSGKALLLRIRDAEHWIPYQCIANADRYTTGDRDVSISIAERIASEKGIEPDE